jgi:hypothetical protein
MRRRPLLPSRRIARAGHGCPIAVAASRNLALWPSRSRRRVESGLFSARSESPFPDLLFKTRLAARCCGPKLP